MLLKAAIALLLCSGLLSAAWAQRFEGPVTSQPSSVAAKWEATIKPQTGPNAMTSKARTDLSVVRDFDFGTLAVDGAGTATVAPSGVVSTAGGVYSAGGFPQAALLSLGAHPNSVYNLMLPGSVTLTNAAGATMVLRSFTFDPGATGSMGNGKKSVALGATLQLSSNASSGAYQGNIEITITYN